MSSEHNSFRDQPPALIVAELGVAAAAAAGTAGYLRYRRQKAEMHRTLDPAFHGRYAASLAIFSEERLLARQPELPRVMATIGVLVFNAGETGAGQVATRNELLVRLHSMHDPVFHVSTTVFNDAMGHLKQNDLVERRANSLNPKSHGYAALPALRWGIEYDEPLDILVQAQAELLDEQL